MRNLRITSEPQASPEETAIIRDGLARFNVAATQHTYYSPLAILLRDDRNAVLGGALGDVWGGWLERYGYEVFAELPNRPAGYASYFMKKALPES